MLVYSNIIKNDYQPDPRVLHTFVPNKLFGHTGYFTQNFYFLKTFNSKFPDIEACFTDQNSEPVEVEQRIPVILLLIKVENKK